MTVARVVVDGRSARWLKASRSTRSPTTLIVTLPAVRATLNYIVRTAEKPYSYTYAPPPGVPLRSGTVDVVDDVQIRNARPIADQLSLDEKRDAVYLHIYDGAILAAPLGRGIDLLPAQHALPD